MKRVYASLLAVTLLALIFFTASGERLYRLGKPIVAVGRYGSLITTGEVVVPIDMVHEEDGRFYIYELSSERGYSFVIYTVKRVEIEIDRYDDEQRRVYLKTDAKPTAGTALAAAAKGKLADGMRVVLQR
ncbi:MAG: hypothetical protein FWF03_01605 [Defluviitaleaceae bacterium]|nr:hypothetical protein [Defluviitaleaceae bacterium]